METPISEIKDKFDITNLQDENSILQISYALSSPERIKIIKSLLVESKSSATLSQELDIPATTLARHIDVLANA